MSQSWKFSGHISIQSSTKQSQHTVYKNDISICNWLALSSVLPVTNYKFQLRHQFFFYESPITNSSTPLTHYPCRMLKYGVIIWLSRITAVTHTIRTNKETPADTKPKRVIATIRRVLINEYCKHSIALNTFAWYLGYNCFSHSTYSSGVL